MSDITSDLPKLDFKAKLGKLPVWLWGVLAAVVALIAYTVWARRSGSATDNSTTPTVNADASFMGYQTSGIKGGQATTETTANDSNASWLARVSRQVADVLAASPTDVYAALQKFLYGQPYDEREKVFIDKAISIGMSPPEGVQGIADSPGSKNVTLSEYIRRSDGQISALYSDGTTHILTYPEWQALAGQGAIYHQVPDAEYNSHF